MAKDIHDILERLNTTVYFYGSLWCAVFLFPSDPEPGRPREHAYWYR